MTTPLAAGPRPVPSTATPRQDHAVAATVASFGRMTGVDLGFVPVVRLPAATTESAVRNAAAFTTGGVLHLPAEAGPEDRADTAALVGHELTHVMQQRALGAAADEDGPLGEALERQAQAVERTLRGEAVAPDELGWPVEAGPPPVGLTWTPETGFGLPAPTVTDGPTQRAPLSTGRSDAEPGAVTDPRDAAAVPEPEPEPLPLYYPEEPASAEGPAMRDQPVGLPTVAELTDEVVAAVGNRFRAAPATWINPRDPELLDALAVGLYGRLRGRLRGELMADRERAGLLTEFH